MAVKVRTHHTQGRWMVDTAAGEIREWRGQKKGYPVDAGTLGVVIRWQVLGLRRRLHRGV
jgi:hypothetical protein